MAKTEHKETVLDLSRNKISRLTGEINSELKKIKALSSKEEKEKIVANCKEKIKEIKTQMKKMKNMKTV